MNDDALLRRIRLGMHRRGFGTATVLRESKRWSRRRPLRGQNDDSEACLMLFAAKPRSEPGEPAVHV